MTEDAYLQWILARTDALFGVTVPERKDDNESQTDEGEE